MTSPLGLIAELTHRCPLRCAYCSNPIKLAAREHELGFEVWCDVIDQAAEMGALHLHLTGGEPLAREDLVPLVARARERGLYVNLITSGVGLNAGRMDQLVEVGLDHVQLSFQDSDARGAAETAGVDVLEAKRKAARLIAERPVGFTVNMVIHRKNIERLTDMIQMAAGLGAQKLEVAHVQYSGWALLNRARLLPTRAQVDASRLVVEGARERLRGEMRIDFVASDYLADFPNACMGGWGAKSMLINPTGRALPCHSASTLPGVDIPDVRVRRLDWIWRESPIFQMFRGTAWMREPCRSCERRELDWGGCRCQAFLLTGAAEATDPACRKSPEHGLVSGATRDQERDVAYRGMTSANPIGFDLEST